MSDDKGFLSWYKKSLIIDSMIRIYFPLVDPKTLGVKKHVV